MSVIADIELKKKSIICAGLEFKTVTFNQKGWDNCLQELADYLDESPVMFALTSKQIFTATNNILGLDVHFDMKQKEDFLIGIF
jgi:hypothetical protein